MMFLSRPKRTRSDRTKSPATTSQARLRVEALEDRVTPTTFVVNTMNDVVQNADNLLSLREALLNANSNMQMSDDAPAGDADGDVILFDSTVFAASAASV